MNRTDNDTHPRPFSPGGLPVLIGSLPLADHAEALDLILAHTPDIPLWPQLPANPGEDMIRQFAGGLAGLRDEDGRLFFDTGAPGFGDELLGFFEDYLAFEETPEQPPERFAVSPGRAPGLRLLAERAAGLDVRAVKGQVTGPFTMSTALKDADQRLAYYDPQLREMIVKAVAAGAGWQTRFLGAPGRTVLTFIDEPALAGLGSSAFIGIDTAELAAGLAEVTAAVHAAGGLAGVHVCANTDWRLLLEPAAGVDIVSFDAHGFFDRFVSDRGLVLSFLDRGGIIAWGIVPTGDEKTVMAESAEGLARRWEEQARVLAGGEAGIADVLVRTLVTPSCGTGSLPRHAAERVLELTAGVSRLLRERFSK